MTATATSEWSDTVRAHTHCYSKIPGPFLRDRETKEMTAAFSDPVFEYLKDNLWSWQEKVDGTNIRVIWDGHAVSFNGRTNRAILPKPLLRHLEEKFATPETEELFEQQWGGRPVVLFGEGYGPGIQRGGKYRDDPAFACFDVWVTTPEGGHYLPRDEAVGAAAGVGADTVADHGRMTLMDAVECVAHYPVSAYGEFAFEGLVGTPLPYLRNHRGGRVIVKVKTTNIPTIVLNPELPTIFDILGHGG